MPALLRAVACGCLLAVPAMVAAQDLPPRDALEALAGVAPPRRAPVSPGAGELDRALAAADWPRAEQLLAQAIERSPRSAALLKQIAGVFLADRRPLNAAIAFKKAEALAPLDAESRFRLVLAYVAMGRGEWARPELERLVADTPATALHHYWLGRLDYDAGQYIAALRHLQDAAARDPAFPRTFDNLGLCYDALNEPERAITYYRESVRLNRLAAAGSPWPPLNLAIALDRRGDAVEAEALLREAIRIDPGAAQAHYHLGGVLEHTDRLDAAVDALRAAVAADPAYAAPQYALARIYRRQGRLSEADAALAAFTARRAAEQAARSGPAVRTP
jgi:tetratricopeptide (TPR) repeat protein